MSKLIPDFRPGPLDFYRKKASFDWKKLKLYLLTEDVIEYQNELLEELRSFPEYSNPTNPKNLDEIRHQTYRQFLATSRSEMLQFGNKLANLRRAYAADQITVLMAPSTHIKYSVGQLLFINTIRTMGSARHTDLLQSCEDGKISGCFCLTEISHGSNAKGMRTTATYDKQKKCFILHTPDFEAAKCWAGNLGQLATHAVIFAQLVIDGKRYGLHNFVVQIRDPRTLLPLPGLIIGDLGEKIGLNGIDNGYIIFKNHEIPRESLLNKVGDVSEDGVYKTPYKDPNKRHGASLGALSNGRVNIAGMCEIYGSKALAIAIRYAGVRKQFGPEGEPEVSLLEYQTHQHRLLPYLAAAYVLKNFNIFFMETQYQFSIDSIFGNNLEILPDLGMEIHGISSASKPMAGWLMRDAIQECRETCGGHGYLKATGIGDLRNDNDASLTYEGENHILIQQTSNWLLKYWPSIQKGEKIHTPLESIDFLTNGLEILKNFKFTAKNIEEISNPTHILNTFQWLVVYLLSRTAEKLSQFPKDPKNQFYAKDRSQVFYAKNLAIAFVQHFFLQRMLVTIQECPDSACQNVLKKLFALYGLWSLEKHLPTLYQGEFVRGPEGTTLIQNGILNLCTELKDDAVALADVIAPPDFVMNSVLGSSDGQVYEHLEASFTQGRPEWWKEVVDNFAEKSKL